MLKSSLCHYSDAYILLKGTVAINNTASPDAHANNTNIKVIFKNCTPFIYSISEINNTQVDNANNIYTVISMYRLIKYIAIIIQKHLEVCGNIAEIYQE